MAKRAHLCCINVSVFLTTHHAFYLHKMRPLPSWLSWLVAVTVAPPRILASNGWTMSGAWKWDLRVSVGTCFKDDEPRVRCVARETFVKLSKRGENSGPGSLWFVIQSVSLCPGPQGFNDDPLACFFLKFTNLDMEFCWRPQREFLAADVRIILYTWIWRVVDFYNCLMG